MDFDNYKKAKSLYDKEAEDAKINYYNSKLDRNQNSSKQIWNELNKLCKPNPLSSISPVSHLLINDIKITDSNNIANTFNSYFVNLATDLLSRIPLTPGNFENYLNLPLPNSFYFTEIKEDEVITEITKLAKLRKSSLEAINPTVLLSVSDLLGKPLAFLFNRSILGGIFPECLKTSKVIPIYKKGSKNDVSNFRPISLLSVFEKVFEKLIHKRLVSFWNKNDIIYKHQYGFRSNHSTTLAITEITDFIYKTLDQGNFILGLYLDISKAFDTVCHDILLKKLSHYGLRGSIYNWFKSYLQDRKQYVLINGSSSTIQHVRHGVPQGSVLGPLLFLIYLNDLPNCLTFSNLRLFADDANSFTCHKNLQILKTQAEQDLANIANWMTLNKLTINIQKTNFTIFSPFIKKPEFNLFDEINLRNYQFKRVNSVSYLGVIIDEDMS